MLQLIPGYFILLVQLMSDILLQDKESRNNQKTKTVIIRKNIAGQHYATSYYQTTFLTMQCTQRCKIDLPIKRKHNISTQNQFQLVLLPNCLKATLLQQKQKKKKKNVKAERDSYYLPARHILVEGSIYDIKSTVR